MRKIRCSCCALPTVRCTTARSVPDATRWLRTATSPNTCKIRNLFQTWEAAFLFSFVSQEDFKQGDHNEKGRDILQASDHHKRDWIVHPFTSPSNRTLLYMICTCR